MTIITKNGVPLTLNEFGEFVTLSASDVVELLRTEIAANRLRELELDIRLLNALNTIVQPNVSPEIWEALRFELGLCDKPASALS